MQRGQGARSGKDGHVGGQDAHQFHTHSGPSLNTRSEAAAAYYKQFVAGVAESIIQAHAALQPARMVWWRIHCQMKFSTAAGI